MTDFSEEHAATASNAAAPLGHVFITGGSGYVGRNLIRHLVTSGTLVTALARSPEAERVVSSLGAQPFLGDLLTGNLAEGMQGCNMLIHAAADTDHGPGSRDQTKINVAGTEAVLRAALRAGISKVVHISTESVLADGRPLVNIDETHPLPRRFAGSYSRSKAAAERQALSFNRPSMEVVVVRPRFVWGRDDTTALPNLVGAVRSGQFAWIDDGNYLTSTTHVANLCSGVHAALTRGKGGEIYFLSDDEPVRFRDFVAALLATQDLHAPDKSVPRALLRLIAGLGEVARKVSGGRVAGPLTLQSYATSAVEITLNIDKARRELGYAPPVSRDAGLAEMSVRGRPGADAPPSALSTGGHG